VENRKIVLLGMMTTMPVAGIVWLTMQYLVGFRRLGYEPYYVEAHARNPSMLMRDASDDASVRAAEFISRVMGRFGFHDNWAFHALHDDGSCLGLSDRELRSLYRDAGLVINLHGGTKPLPEHTRADQLVLIDTDPVQIQLEIHESRAETFQFLDAHSALFTWAENLDNPDCLLPSSGRFPFLPTRQPIVLDFWEPFLGLPGTTFTTVGNWRQGWRELTFGGEAYSWSKHHEFLKLGDLPRRTSHPFELALSRCPPEDRSLLQANGWRVRDALAISHDADVYREYLGSSLAEFTVAKDQNVRLRTGWFSDRSAAYLATGTPVVTQDTGFGGVIPTGEGVLSFSTPQDALDAAEAVAADPTRHGRAARRLAEEHFDSDKVLSSLLRHLDFTARTNGHGVARRRAARVGTPEPGGALRVLLVSHRFPPDATAGVERYTEAVATALTRRGDEVAVATRRPSAAREITIERERKAGLPVVYRLTGEDGRRDRFLYHDERLTRLFDEILEEFEPDVVHFNHTIDLSPQLLQRARERGVGFVVTLHDYYFACARIIRRKTTGEICSGPAGGAECAATCFADDGPDAFERWGLRTAYFRRLLSLPDLILCPSEYTASWFRQFAPTGARVEALPNGTWIERTDAAAEGFGTPHSRGRLSVAFVGSLLPHKGPHLILDALQFAGLHAVQLIMLGDVAEPVYAKRLRAQAAEIPGLELRMFGTYEPDDLALLLHDVDCVVLPSLWPETFGLVTREALALGIPVVATRVGALVDPIVDGVNGFTLGLDDTATELADVLRRLAEDVELVPTLRRGASRTHLASIDEHVAALRNRYLTLLPANSRRERQTEADSLELDVLHRALLGHGFGRFAPADVPVMPTSGGTR
jgi:glycosyltransferase involved in cell wall biosynthesis